MAENFSFGYWVRRRRRALDLTQADLAQRASCSLSMLRKIEADERRPSLQLIELLAGIFALDPDERAMLLRVARAERGADQLELATQPLESPNTALPPSGMVTFLFTDIVGSTRLWEQHPEAMPDALARHDALLHEAVAAHGGHVFKTVGDAVHAVFTTPHAALAAAVQAQRALRIEAWDPHASTERRASNNANPPFTLAVRMALHTGAVQLRGDDYFGSALSRAARLVAAGHDGQILLSAATAELVRDHLPTDVALRDLGAHWLRSMARPDQIFQLCAPDLPDVFPALATIARQISNLPTPTTAFIGREREIAAVTELLTQPAVRLLTLTGPGGTGKTRLALQASSHFFERAQFPNGVWFVNLAPISDSELVATAIAQALDVSETSGQPLRDSVKSYLRAKRMLLLLDNFEQVVEAAPLVSELLAAAPGLTVLVTSRMPLRLSGEHEYAVPPLALPPQNQATNAEQVGQHEAVRLFVDHALASRSDFALTDANAAAVADICRALDGLPLAIELAAARVKLFAPAALLARLANRLPLLTGGPRDAPSRHQNLSATLDWSFHLLTDDEQRLFARLGVFVGGCTLAAAEAVCNADGDLSISMIDGIAALVNQSIVPQAEGSDGESRFVMLETIREYALAKLHARNEYESAARAHAMYFLHLAETQDDEPAWLVQMEREHNNLRATLHWALAYDAHETGLRLCMAVWWFWESYGYWREGRQWTETMLAAADHAAPALRMQALRCIGEFAWKQGDYAQVDRRMTECVRIAVALHDTGMLAHAKMILGKAALDQGNVGAAGDLLNESVALWQALGEDAPAPRMHVGELALVKGEYERARPIFEETLTLCEATEDYFIATRTLCMLGETLLGLGDHQGARRLLRESVLRSRAVWHHRALVFVLTAFAGAVASDPAARADDVHAAVRIWGAIEVVREDVGVFVPVTNQSRYERALAYARTRVSPDAWAAAWKEGQAMPLEQAVAEALNIEGTDHDHVRAINDG